MDKDRKKKRTWIIDHVLMVDGEKSGGSHAPRPCRNRPATAPLRVPHDPPD